MKRLLLAILAVGTIRAFAAPTLLHRWSFNGNAEDSIGTKHGKTEGNVTYINNNTAISLAGGSKGTSWVELNADGAAGLLPEGDKPFTIEMWTTLREVTNYSACFTLGKRDVTDWQSNKGILVAFYNPGIKSPAFKPMGGVNTDYRIGYTALENGGTYHLVVVVRPRGDNNGAAAEVYIHNALTGAPVGFTAGVYDNWTTSSIIQESFALGRNFYGDNDPKANFDEVRVWEGALAIDDIVNNISAGPDALPESFASATIDDTYFKHEFTTGERKFTGNNGSDPAGVYKNDTPVLGSNGPDTAVFAQGFGSIHDGDNVLNSDWTIAMSVKPSNAEKAVLLSLGSIQNSGKKMFVVASSSTPGALYLPIFQNWGGGSAKNYIPADANKVTGLGDMLDTFHSLVAVHVARNANRKGGVIKIYWDGKLIQTFDSSNSCEGRAYGNGFQLLGAHGGFGDINDFHNGEEDKLAAYQDVRFYSRALSADEVGLYAQAFPAATTRESVATDSLMHRWSFNGSLEDSVGTRHAVLQGGDKANMAFINGNTEISLTDGDGGADRSWIDLGKNLFPRDLGDTPFTIELWTTLRDLQIWRPCFSIGFKGTNDGRKGLHVAYHDVHGPFFNPTKAVASGVYLGSGNKVLMPEAQFPTNEKCHMVLVVQPDGNGNAYVQQIVHKADGTFIGDNFEPIGSWTTASFEDDYEFMLGRGFYGDSNPKASFDEVRVWKTALTRQQIKENISLGPDKLPKALITPNDTFKNSVFRYDFSNGTGALLNNDTSISRVTESWMGFVPVHGTNGFGTAVHPCGEIKFSNGKTLMNGDWTLAMSVKSTSVDNSLLVALGGDTNVSREYRLVASSTEGVLKNHIAQRWSTGYEPNVPARLELTNLGDTTNMFHSLVAVHRACDAKIKLFWDGILVGEFNSLHAMGSDKRFSDAIRFGTTHFKDCSIDNTPCTYPETIANPDVAYQDIRFFSYKFTGAEVLEYASMYPAAKATSGDINDYHFRHDFTKGKCIIEGDGFIDSTDVPMAGSGTRVPGPTNGSRGATFPDYTRLGSVDGGYERDWTLAMSVKFPVVTEGNAILMALGSIKELTKALTIATTKNSSDGLFIAMAQHWGGGVGEYNVCNARVTIDNLGDTTNMFHTLVISHQRNGRARAGGYGKTGVFAIYWDGDYVGSITDSDSSDRPMPEMLRYGGVYDVNPHDVSNNGNESYNPPYVEMVDSSSGLAFQDVRFCTNVWTSAEAEAYAEAFPVMQPISLPGLRIIVR